MKDRNEKIIESLQALTTEMVNDPVKLAAWVKRQRKWQEAFDEYMRLDRHEGDCHCHRCISEFLAAQDTPQ